MLASELDDELGEHVDDDVARAGKGVLEEVDTLFDREQRRLVRRVAHDTHDHPVEDRGRATDDVNVAVRDGVVAPWADCCDHREKTVIRAEP